MATRPTTPNIPQSSSQQITNYQLGDCLGKGAFAQVFRALNWTTGETVAIKQIQLSTIPKGDLGEIMAEIDLLKNLNHPNIVKYKGFVKTQEYLNIILEYCENGSLHNICKRFGKFPESLVAVYISQVLHGLVYLHDQGVIHRDIKGANILTNKDGCVKLADFGVATAQVSDSTVVGSPYWMAPEVIEQLGATTASDIWSVGCVVIELLEGKPPYHFLDPMPALFRIVQDDCPPIPEGASSIVKDFLYHCFQKDCNLRISAKKLLRHPWMISAKRQMNNQIKPTSTELPNNGAKSHPASNYNFDDAVQKVQQWNEALKSPTKPAQPKRVRSPSPTPAPRMGEINAALTWKLASPPSRSRSASAGMASGLPYIPNLLPLANPTPAMARPMVVPEIEEATDNWDADFEEDITLTKLQMLERSTSTQSQTLSLPAVSKQAAPSTSQGIFSKKATPTKKTKQTATKADPVGIGSPEPDDANARTIKPTPTQSPTISSKKKLPSSIKPKELVFTAPPVPPLPADVAKKSSTMEIPPSTSAKESPKESKPHIRKDSSDENYDDLLGDDDDLFSKVESFKLKAGPRRGPFFPSEIRTTGLTAAGPGGSPGPKTAPILPRRSSHPDLPSPTFPLTSSSSMSRFNGPITPPSSISRASISETNLKKIRSHSELKRYTEEEDEDYDDVFGKVPASGSGQTIQTLKLNFSNKSWLVDDGSDSDDEDPFAEIDEEFPEDDFETNLQRDKHARLCAEVNQLIDDLSPNSPDPTLRRACDQIINILDVNPDLYSQVVSAHGMLAILEVLESKPSRDVILRLLEIINLLVNADYGVLESFCLIGGIPVLMGFTSKKYSSECRLEASKTIRMLCHTSVLTLQMFISCRGLRVLVDILDEDYIEQTELVSHALNGIGSVFDLQSPTPKNDFCRMFIREGLLDPLSTALINVITAKDNLRASEMKTRIIQILLVFTQASQSDAYVRNAVGTRKVIRCLLRGCELVEPEYLIMLLKAIKHLSMSPSLLDVLQNANSIEILITLLTQHMSGPHGTDISNSVFQTCYNLCRLNKSRQEEAAQAGILPCLKRVIINNSPLRQFALPILCDMASAGKSCRSLLWQHDGLSIYLDLLSDPYFQVSALEAILSWLQDDMARVEDVLAERSSIECILKCFITAKANSFENILDPLLKIIRTSSPVAIGLAKPDFFQRLTDRLTHHKAVVRLNLLRLLKAICDIHPDRASLVERFGLYEVVERLSRTDSAVLVRELAREIVPVLLPGRGDSKLFSKHNVSMLESRASAANRSAGALLDPRSLDEIAKGRKPLNHLGPIFPPRKAARRAASETSSPPLGALSPIPRSPDNSLLGESGTAKRVRPVPIQRRSARDAVGMLASNSSNASGSGVSARVASTSNHSPSTSQDESRASKRRSTAL